MARKFTTKVLHGRQVCLPVDLLRMLGLEEGAYLELVVEDVNGRRLFDLRRPQI